MRTAHTKKHVRMIMISRCLVVNLFILSLIIPYGSFEEKENLLTMSLVDSSTKLPSVLAESVQDGNYVGGRLFKKIYSNAFILPSLHDSLLKGLLGFEGSHSSEVYCQEPIRYRGRHVPYWSRSKHSIRLCLEFCICHTACGWCVEWWMV